MMKRRSFLKTVSAVTGGYAFWNAPSIRSRHSWRDPENELPRRNLGGTGEKISVVGFPGLALAKYEQAEGTRGIHAAFERGMNYFDVAPAYGKGDAEIKMGIGLRGIDRSRIFLACKTKMRDKKGAREELERSLRRLKTDYFDLYQLHLLKTKEEVQEALGAGGAMDTILRAREEGKIKHLGFSAHTTIGALEAMKRFQFDTVMFPINFVEFYKRGYCQPVLEEAQRRGMGILAIKPMSLGSWPKDAQKSRQWWYRTPEEQEDVNLAMNFTLSQDSVIAGIPPSYLDLTNKAIVAAGSLKVPSKQELEKMKDISSLSISQFQEQERKAAMGGHRIDYFDLSSGRNTRKPV